MPAPFSVGVSEVDSARFGLVYVRANNVAAADVSGLLAYCREHGAGVCVARCDVGDFAAMEALENEGFRLKDTLVYYEAALERTAIPEPRLAIPIRPVKPGEAGAVGRSPARPLPITSATIMPICASTGPRWTTPLSLGLAARQWTRASPMMSSSPMTAACSPASPRSDSMMPRKARACSSAYIPSIRARAFTEIS